MYGEAATPSGGLSSADYYDTIASAYTALAARRRTYLDAVDGIVVRAAAVAGPGSLLDIGCGDGRRCEQIARALGIAQPVGIDESGGMLALAAGRDIVLHQGRITELSLAGPFDLVTCLWNTLGHVAEDERVATLAAIRDLLATDGVLCLDVNNRYNIRAYGAEVVERNLRDDLASRRAGDVLTTTVIDGHEVRTTGHVFHPFEVDELVAAAGGLQVRARHYLDYDTGEPAPRFFEGQVLYEITRRV